MVNITKINFIFPLIILILFSFNNNIVNAVENIGHVDECEENTLIKYKKNAKSSSEIKELQKWLKANKYYINKVDGIYGKKTMNAVKNFQKNNNLKVDGVVGINTWKKIGSYKFLSVSQPNTILPQRKTVLIDLLKRKLFLVINDKPNMNFYIAIGKLQTPTPIGQWNIKNKSVNWGTGFGTRWLGLNVNWGLYGIHGTNKPWSIGKSSSHGCIRMYNRDVEVLYKYVKIGEEINIYGNPFGVLEKPLRVLMKGEKGTDVVEIQKQLRRLGYYKKSIDGVFGTALENSIKVMQKDMKVEKTAQIREKEYKRLGFGRVLEVRERKSKYEK